MDVKVRWGGGEDKRRLGEPEGIRGRKREQRIWRTQVAAKYMDNTVHAKLASVGELSDSGMTQPFVMRAVQLAYHLLPCRPLTPEVRQQLDCKVLLPAVVSTLHNHLQTRAGRTGQATVTHMAAQSAPLIHSLINNSSSPTCYRLEQLDRQSVVCLFVSRLDCARIAPRG